MRHAEDKVRGPCESAPYPQEKRRITVEDRIAGACGHAAYNVSSSTPSALICA